MGDASLPSRVETKQGVTSREGEVDPPWRGDGARAAPTIRGILVQRGAKSQIQHSVTTCIVTDSHSAGFVGSSSSFPLSVYCENPGEAIF